MWGYDWQSPELGIYRTKDGALTGCANPHSSLEADEFHTIVLANLVILLPGEGAGGGGGGENANILFLALGKAILKYSLAILTLHPLG